MLGYTAYKVNDVDYIYIPNALPNGTAMVSFTVAARPAANAVGAIPGSTVVMAWNIDDHSPEFSDGVNWYDANGNLT